MHTQALKVGSWLRSRYVEQLGFLPDLTGSSTSSGSSSGSSSSSTSSGTGSEGDRVWDSSIATLRTTPIRRTIATLRGVLTGLWPGLEQPTAAGVAAAAAAAKDKRRRRLAAGAVPPLPVGASAEELEIMYGNNNTCARLTPLYAALQKDLDGERVEGVGRLVVVSVSVCVGGGGAGRVMAAARVWGS